MKQGATYAARVIMSSQDASIYNIPVLHVHGKHWAVTVACYACMQVLMQAANMHTL